MGALGLLILALLAVLVVGLVVAFDEADEYGTIPPISCERGEECDW